MKKESYIEQVENVGRTKRDRDKYALIKDVKTKSPDSISYKDVKINDVETKLTIASGTMANKKNISSMCGEVFHVGDIVEYSESKWLVVKADVDEEIYIRGQMQQCNYRLRWQNKNKEIVEYDCIIESASQYNSGEESYKAITIGYNQNLIFIPLNEDTRYLHSDDRFFIDNNRVNPKVYRATRVDTVTEVYEGIGYVTVLVTEDQYNADTDNIDMFICNYKENENIPDDIEITYRGESKIICGGSYKTFTADRNVTWDLDCLPEQEPYIQTEVSNNKIKIKCANKLNLIGSTFKLTCIDDDGNNGELYIDIIGM